MNSLAVYIIIPTGGDRPDLLARTLASVAQLNKIELVNGVIVAENGVRSSCRELIETIAFPTQLQYHWIPEPGKSKALNVVMANLFSGLAILFDDDIRLEAGVLQEYLLHRESQPGRYFYGGPMGVDYEIAPEPHVVRALPRSAKGFWLNIDQDFCDLESPQFLGCNWAVHIEDVLRIGGFDVNRGPGSTSNATGQEQNMQNRLVENGLKGRYLSKAMVYHYVPQDRSSESWLIERGFRTGRAVRLEMQRKGVVRTWLRGTGYMAKQAVREAMNLSGSKYIRLTTRIGREVNKGFFTTCQNE